MSETPRTAGRFVWFDLETTDVEEARGFYTSLFPAWSMAKPPGETGEVVALAGRPIARVVPIDAAAGRASRWIAGASVLDVEAACAKVSALGGRVVEAPAPLAGVGVRALVADLEGAALAVVQLDEEAPEHAGPMPDGAFCWYEVLEKSPTAAVAFYTALFGWSHAEVPTPMGPYHLFRRGERDAAGLLPMPAEAAGPAMWLAYLYASDLEGAQAKVQALGGRVLRAVQPVPGIGSFTIVADPMGAVLALFRSERG